MNADLDSLAAIADPLFGPGAGARLLAAYRRGGETERAAELRRICGEQDKQATVKNGPINGRADPSGTGAIQTVDAKTVPITDSMSNADKRMAEAKRAFSEAAPRVLANDPEAVRLAADALEAIREARADLAGDAFELASRTQYGNPTIGDRYAPTSCACVPWEPCTCGAS